MNKFFLVALTCLTFLSACTTPKTQQKTEEKTRPNWYNNSSTSGFGTLAFYNVENLFDTFDDPKTKDDEFLPTAKKQWTVERYQTKLNHLYEVLQGLGSTTKTAAFPDIVGVAEIENELVLNDLINKTPIPDAYKVVHYDSDDVRGIDVGLIYNPDFIDITLSYPLKVVYDMDTSYIGRDLLYAQGELPNGEKLHLYVNHWKSRRGGAEQTEPKRKIAARLLRMHIDGILAVNPNANIIVMGDFNDGPTNNSIVQVLKSVENPSQPNQLSNLLAHKLAAGEGTHNYRGEWNVLDQLISTTTLSDNTKPVYIVKDSPAIYKEEFMLYKGKNGYSPSRTYGGPNYYGGYSDHLPVYLQLGWR